MNCSDALTVLISEHVRSTENIISGQNVSRDSEENGHKHRKHTGNLNQIKNRGVGNNKISNESKAWM